jgi:hypothetical protein
MRSPLYSRFILRIYRYIFSEQDTYKTKFIYDYVSISFLSINERDNKFRGREAKKTTIQIIIELKRERNLRYFSEMTS